MDPIEKLKALLEDTHEFPTQFSFKFIVPDHQFSTLRELFSHVEDEFISTKPSKTGKYISVTIAIVVDSSDHILAVYKSVSTIEGVVSL
jgi:putative lipoic acid-binding regulatory protein